MPSHSQAQMQSLLE